MLFGSQMPELDRGLLPIYELSSLNIPYKLARVKESTFPWWFCVFGGLGGSAGWVTSGPHWFPLCLYWSGDVVDSRCQGDNLGPMKLAFGGGGGGGCWQIEALGLLNICTLMPECVV